MNPLLKQVLFIRWPHRLLILGLSLLATCFGLLGPYFQKEFVDSLTGQVSAHWLHLIPDKNPLFYVSAAFACILISSLFSQLTNLVGALESIWMQKHFSRQLYEKTLSLRLDTLSSRPVGEMVQLYAADVPGSTVFLDQTIPMGATTLFPLILAPLALIFLFDAPVWPTLSLMAFIIAFNTYMALRQSRFFYLFKKLAGDRIGLVNEWIQNIRTIRILGWIPSFEKRIFSVRTIETKNRVSMVTNGQIMNAVSTSITFILNIVTLGSLVYLSNAQLTSGEILALLWIVGVFLVRPFRQMPWFFTFAFDSWTSIKRLEKFLYLENPPHQFANDKTPHYPSHTALAVTNLNLAIGAKQILSQIDLEIKEGEFVAIVGEVGSGKSMLLYSLLGETGAHFSSYYLLGKMLNEKNIEEARGQFALVPQEGFIMSASLRDNVAFCYDTQHEVDPDIEDSLRLAQFDLDTERVEDGLNTQIGERGVNLSGGQKQRVSLARIHYMNAPILMMDDCLSAVDVDTENKLLEHLLDGSWKGRTRLLVTHRLSVLPRVDRIVFLENGQIIAQGTFNELLAHNQKFRDFTVSLAKEKADA